MKSRQQVQTIIVTRFGILIFGLVLVTTAAGQRSSGRPILPLETTVEIKSKDNLFLKGSLYSPGRAGPGVILFHQCNKDRTSWDRLALKLSQSGFHVLAIDLRGFGESQGEQWKWEGSLEKATDYWRTNWVDDMEAAFERLISEPGVDPNTIAAGGASCGVYMSLLLAVAHPKQIKALVLLSGFSDGSLRDFVSRSPTLPILGAASEEDGLAFLSTKEVMSLAHNRNSRMLTYKNAGHGTNMFEKEPDLMPFVVNWLISRLHPPSV